MQIESYTSQCFIHSQLQISELVAISKSLNLKNFIRYFPL